MGCDASKSKLQELERINEEIKQTKQLEQKIADELEKSEIEIKQKQESQVKASAKIAHLELKMSQLEGFIDQGQH